jgi:hypothetical protein
MKLSSLIFDTLITFCAQAGMRERHKTQSVEPKVSHLAGGVLGKDLEVEMQLF